MDPEETTGDGEPKNSATPEPKTPAPAKATDWEGAYSGLQKTLARKQKSLDELQEKYDQLQEAHEALKLEHRNASGSVQSYEAKLLAKDTEIAKLTGELQGAQSLQKRTQLIAKDYPDLLQFEADGLLPTGSNEEELKSKLDKFKETLGKLSGQQVAEKIKGAGPSQHSATQVELNEDQIYDRLAALAGTTDPILKAEYDKLLEQWHKLRENT